VKQLTRIERREARIRRIRNTLGRQREVVPNILHGHHHIALSQKYHEHIGTFLRTNAGDPATTVRHLGRQFSRQHHTDPFGQNFLPKLKRHLLPRVLKFLQNRIGGEGADDNNISHDSILFKHDRIYRHSLLRINYTAYDVRRSQDVVHTSTSHCNIMMLAASSSNNADASPSHPFCYAQVLGIYHANIVYVGPGMVDYQPQCFEFLWVRWYKVMEKVPAGWTARRLDRIRFPPLAKDDSFGFVDPSDVLRGCHIMPRFSKGQLHSDGKGLSKRAGDSSDWAEYYVGR